jgi:hypothetical protein
MDREDTLAAIVSAVGAADFGLAVLRRAAFAVVNENPPSRIAGLLRMAAGQLNDLAMACDKMAAEIEAGDKAEPAEESEGAE